MHEPGLPQERISNAPPLEDLPESWDAKNGVEFKVSIRVNLGSIQVRLDTGDFSVKYSAGIQGTGTISATTHGVLPTKLRLELETFAKQQIEKLYV